MKIICIGRNYAEHAKELGNKIEKEPVFFLKPDSALLQKNKPFFYPDFSNEIHYEAELVFRLKRIGKHIDKKFAHKYIDSVTVGIDFTARDIQQACKQKGLPWEKAKAFDGSAVVGNFYSVERFPDITQLQFSLKKNGETVQQGNAEEMIFNVFEIIEYVSRYMTLKIGDLIFTGTPKGVGPVAINDVLEGYLENEKVFELKVK
ncbi:MAG: FAA hydrolase family protein [Bacteroidetes bacterium]|nr:MAG: FAA hydrolase family protein [Bacteroidota bacterium]